MIDIAVTAAKEAGKVLLKHYGNVKTEFKGGGFHAGNIVSQADLEAEEVIASVLRQSFPDHNLIAEEKVHEDNGSVFTWYIDPLDGTSNFTRNIPLFGISIGLLKDGVPVLGVLFFPVLDLLLTAEKGKGTFVNGKPAKVSARPLNVALYYAGGLHEQKLLVHDSVASKVGLVKIVDSTAFELAQIAMGDAELYVMPNSVHDVAAGIVIVEEAGGQVSDSKGDPWTPGSKDIVVSNSVIHDEILSLLR